MKKVIQICFVFVIFCGVAATAGILQPLDATDSLQTAQSEFNHYTMLYSSDSMESESTAKHNQPIEPGALFLFGVGIIGIITVHHWKFQ